MTNPNTVKAIELMAAFNDRITAIANASDNPRIMVKPMRATINLFEDALEWNKGTRTFAEWLTMNKRYFYDAAMLSIDSTGQLGEIADQYTALDLTDYFENHVGNEARDVEIIAIKKRILEETLKDLVKN